MNDLPIITQTNQSLRRAHCQYCGGKGDSLKAETVRSPLGIGYRIPLSHTSCKQSVLSLSLSLSMTPLVSIRPTMKARSNHANPNR